MLHYADFQTFSNFPVFSWSWVRQSEEIIFDTIGTYSFPSASPSGRVREIPPQGSQTICPGPIGGIAYVLCTLRLTTKCSSAFFMTSHWHPSSQSRISFSVFLYLYTHCTHFVDVEMIQKDVFNCRFGEIKEKLTPYLKKCGFNPKTDIYYIPVSGLTGANLKDTATDLCPWYSGPSLIDYIDNLPTMDRMEEGPIRIPIVDRYKVE